MNISNYEHFAVLFIFGLLWMYRCRFWTFFALAMVCIEIDQALNYVQPWYLWFLQLDTIFDLIFGALGAAAAKWFYQFIYNKTIAWENDHDY